MDKSSKQFDVVITYVCVIPNTVSQIPTSSCSFEYIEKCTISQCIPPISSSMDYVIGEKNEKGGMEVRQV